MTYRIPTIIRTPDGTLLVSVEARKDGAGDWSDINTILRRSTDGGKTWEAPLTIIDDGVNTVNNNTFIVDNRHGRLHLMHAINYERVYWRSSKDNGHRWLAPREITEVFDMYRTRDNYKWTVVAPGMSPGIVLSQGKHKGRYVVPVWLALEHRHRPSIVTTVYSDDQGKTWQAGEIIAGIDKVLTNPSETLLMEMTDGRVMAQMRDESPNYRRDVSFSPDGATGWSTPVADDELYDPTCQAALLRYAPEQLLFCNPDSSAQKDTVLKWGARRRENLTVRMSFDDGETWPLAKVLEPGPAGYCQLAKDDKGMIYCIFERGSLSDDPGKFAPRYVTLAKFNLAWLTGESTE